MMWESENMNELSKKKDISRQVQFINSSALDCCTKDNVHLLPFDCSFSRLGVLQLAHIMYGVPRFNTAYSWFCLPKLLGLSNIIIKTNHTWSISKPYISMTNTERSADCCLRLLLSNSMCFFDNNNVVQCGWGQLPHLHQHAQIHWFSFDSLQYIPCFLRVVVGCIGVLCPFCQVGIVCIVQLFGFEGGWGTYNESFVHWCRMHKTSQSMPFRYYWPGLSTRSITLYIIHVSTVLEE